MKTIWVVFIASMTGFADAKITREAIDNCDDLGDQETLKIFTHHFSWVASLS